MVYNLLQLQLVCGLKMKYCVHVFNMVTQQFIRRLSEQIRLTYCMDSKLWMEKKSEHYCEQIWLLIQNDGDLFDHMFFTYEVYFRFIYMLIAEYGAGSSMKCSCTVKKYIKGVQFCVSGWFILFSSEKLWLLNPARKWLCSHFISGCHQMGLLVTDATGYVTNSIKALQAEFFGNRVTSKK